MLDQFAAEWTEMIRQQNAQSMEVEQLRTINKKLSAQVRSLEVSLAQINEEHCELVKQVVSTRLEKEELEDELVRVKMALAQESLVSCTCSCCNRYEMLMMVGSSGKKGADRSLREALSLHLAATVCQRRQTIACPTEEILLHRRPLSNSIHLDFNSCFFRQSKVAGTRSCSDLLLCPSPHLVRFVSVSPVTRFVPWRRRTRPSASLKASTRA